MKLTTKTARTMSNETLRHVFKDLTETMVQHHAIFSASAPTGPIATKIGAKLDTYGREFLVVEAELKARQAI